MAESKSTYDEQHPRRVAQILRRARHEVGVRDTLTFFGARMWTVALAVGAVLYALLGRWLATGVGKTDRDQ